MIPTFPNFKNVDLTDKDEVLAFTSKFKSYADFNFTNLWSWNTLETRKLSILNNNLVIQFSDYLDNSTFFSCIGTNDLNKSLKSLTEYSINNFDTTSLKFIPEELTGAFDSQFEIVEDYDNNDYVYSTDNLIKNSGNDLKPKRRAIKKFLSSHPTVKLITTNQVNDKLIKEIFELVEQWGKNKQSAGKPHNLVFETLALNRLLRSTDYFDLLISLVYIEDKLTGFAIDEILANKQALSHFIKADVRYAGIYEFMNYEIATILHSKGISEWNWEQDLGLPGLRQIKISYRPKTMYRKFKVSLKCAL